MTETVLVAASGEAIPGLLHASVPFPIALSSRWRVSLDRLQWVLERLRGGRWHASAFCCTREVLLRNIRERAETVDPAALIRIAGLPQWHPDRCRDG
jgi:hypothetical protein